MRSRARALVALVLVGCGGGHGGAPPGEGLEPIVECVEETPSGLVAWFGYDNPGPAVTLPIGPDNRFLGAYQDLGQPVDLAAGRVLGAFSVPLDRARLTWRLRGPSTPPAFATASDESPRCATSVVAYLDVDGDGFGDDATAVVSPFPPAGTVLVGGDCDDDRADVYPGAPELCDGVDHDCDGTVGEPARVLSQIPNDATGNGAVQSVMLGDLVLVAQYQAGLAIYDASVDPPALVSRTLRAGRPAWGVAAQGSLAYVASNLGGIAVYDVSVPSAPVLLAEVQDALRFFRIELSGARLFAASPVSGLVVFDLADPTLPVLESITGGVGFLPAQDVAVEGDLVLVAVRENGVTVVDASVAGAPVRLARVTPLVAWAVELRGGLAAVVSRTSSLTLLDVSSPPSPSVVSSLALAGEVQAVRLDAGYAVVSAYDPSGPPLAGAISFVDVSDSVAPVLEGTLATPLHYGTDVLLAADASYLVPGLQNAEGAITQGLGLSRVAPGCF